MAAATLFALVGGLRRLADCDLLACQHPIEACRCRQAMQSDSRGLALIRGWAVLQEFRQSERDIQEWPDFCAARIAAGKENVAQSPGMSRLGSGVGSTTAAPPGAAALSRVGSDGHASNSSGDCPTTEPCSSILSSPLLQDWLCGW